MFDDILIATDPEDSESQIPAVGFELAAQVGGDVHLLAVVDDPPQRDQIRADRESEVHELLASAVQRAEHRGVHADEHVISGVPAEEILAAIDDLDIDLVVMGTKARSGLDKLVVGSVAESVIEESPVPVLTVPPAVSIPEMPDTSI